MPQDLFIVPNIALEKYRQQAKKLKQATGIPHYQALDQVVKTKGFNHWHHAIESAKATSITEKAFYAGLIICMDIKEAQDFDVSNGSFVADDRFPYLVKSDFIESMKNQIDDEGHKIVDGMSEEEIDALVEEDMYNYVFYRWQNENLPENMDEVQERISECSYWPAISIWFKGEFYDLY